MVSVVLGVYKLVVGVVNPRVVFVYDRKNVHVGKGRHNAVHVDAEFRLCHVFCKAVKPRYECGCVLQVLVKGLVVGIDVYYHSACAKKNRNKDD